MVKRYEWSLVPYPYFRAFTLFNAFVLSSITLGIITGFSIELRNYFVEREQKIQAMLPTLERNKSLGYNPGEHIKYVKTEIVDTYTSNLILPRAIRAAFVSAILSFCIYLLMYFLFGFGGSMTSPRRRWRLFSSIKGNKAGRIFV